MKKLNVALSCLLMAGAGSVFAESGQIQPHKGLNVNFMDDERLNGVKGAGHVFDNNDATGYLEKIGKWRFREVSGCGNGASSMSDAVCLNMSGNGVWKVRSYDFDTNTRFYTAFMGPKAIKAVLGLSSYYLDDTYYKISAPGWLANKYQNLYGYDYIYKRDRSGFSRVIKKYSVNDYRLNLNSENKELWN